MRDYDDKKLRPAGGYGQAASSQTAALVYDGICWFCEKFLDGRNAGPNFWGSSHYRDCGGTQPV